jgi:hypothetical protein
VERCEDFYRTAHSSFSEQGKKRNYYTQYHLTYHSFDLGAYPNTSQYVVNVISKRRDLGAYVTCGDLAYAGKNTKRNENWGIMNQKLLCK